MEPFYLVIRRLEITIIVVFLFLFLFFFSLVVTYYILGDPGATSLFEGQKSPWELTLTEPVPEIVEFVPLIGPKKMIFLANQRGGPAGELCRLLTRCGFLLRLACAIG